MAAFLTLTHTQKHTPVSGNRKLCPHWRGDRKSLRSLSLSCSRTHTHTVGECCADGALTSHRMFACVRTALICSAAAAQRPQCGCDTCQGETGLRGREPEG